MASLGPLHERLHHVLYWRGTSFLTHAVHCYTWRKKGKKCVIVCSSSSIHRATKSPGSRRQLFPRVVVPLLSPQASRFHPLCMVSGASKTPLEWALFSVEEFLPRITRSHTRIMTSVPDTIRSRRELNARCT